MLKGLLHIGGGNSTAVLTLRVHGHSHTSVITQLCSLCCCIGCTMASQFSDFHIRMHASCNKWNDFLCASHLAVPTSLYLSSAYTACIQKLYNENLMIIIRYYGTGGNCKLPHNGMCLVRLGTSHTVLCSKVNRDSTYWQHATSMQYRSGKKGMLH